MNPEPLKQIVDRVIETNAHVQMKRQVTQMLQDLKERKPLDPEQLEPVLRGYISVMDMLITVLS